jgi:protein-disulfide isomerase
MSIGLILALVVALPLFVWALVNLNFNQKEKAASGEPIDIAAGEPVIGLPDAPVTIVVYSDFQCSFCKEFVDNTMSTILANYPNEVKLVFKDYPILSLHPLAERAAISGQCAFEQGKFWEMHDLIFENQATLREVDFINFATQLNLDMTEYASCSNGKLTLPEVQDDMTEGQFKGVGGTPTFFIGKSSNFVDTSFTIIGAQPYEVFKTVIDEKLDLSQLPTPTATGLASASPTAIATPTDSAIGGYVEGEPNGCGGTCGSNYNCKANFYCYQGFCRNPICSDDTDCNCSSDATAKPTVKPTTKAVGGASGSLSTISPRRTSTAKASTRPTSSGGISKGLLELIETENTIDGTDEVTPTAPENQFFTKYAIYIFAGFVVLAITAIAFALKKKKDDNIPHILPPTNI